MTPQCQEWIAYCAKKYPCKGDVLEVGSFDVNGNPREHFLDRERFQSYIGVDMREGPCVDKVMNTQQMEFADNTFGVIVDAERMEHDNRFWVTIKELYRVCKPGGHIIITTRSWGGMHPHDYPSDYWRFMDNGLRDLLEYAGFSCLATAYGERWAAGDKAVFAIGRKPLAAERVERPFSVVILSAGARNLVPCVNAILKHEPELPVERIVVVDDGARKEAEHLLPPVTWVSGSKPFIFSRNANIGIAKANSDVILLNDDAILQTPKGFSKLAKHGRGLTSAAIRGLVGNANQKVIGNGLWPEHSVLRRERSRLCFVAVFIPKAVQDAIGTLDERFVGYGFEDDDYSRRAVEAGFTLNVYDGCMVEHESLKPTWRSNPGWVELMGQNQKLYQEKYADS